MKESSFLYLSHNVSNLVYHIVCSAKYRRIVFEVNVDEHLKQICLGIELRYDYIKFFEIGTDKDHVHFWVQSTPNYSLSQIVKIIKSITEKEYMKSYYQRMGNNNYYVLVIKDNN